MSVVLSKRAAELAAVAEQAIAAGMGIIAIAPRSKRPDTRFSPHGLNSASNSIKTVKRWHAEDVHSSGLTTPSRRNLRMSSASICSTLPICVERRTPDPIPPMKVSCVLDGIIHPETPCLRPNFWLSGWRQCVSEAGHLTKYRGLGQVRPQSRSRPGVTPKALASLSTTVIVGLRAPRSRSLI